MKFLLLTKKHLVTLGCILLALIIGTAISVNAFAKSDRLLPIYCVKTEEKKIALTFDAAWGNSKKVQNLYYVNFSNL